MKNNRRNFLKLTGLAGAASLLPFGKIIGNENSGAKADACALIPTETAGPFPLDLTENSTFFRQDIREGKTGVQLNVKLRIIGSANCLPMQNARVNIWHCDKDGLYSGYSQQNNQGQAGLTYLRGYQFTDANGEVEFVTIFPGWYSGRICHIHFQVYVSSSYSVISQLTFPVAEKNAIYANNSSLYTKGADPLTFATDNIFSDGYNLQLATLTPNSTTGGYDTFLEVTIQGSGVISSLGHLEKENAKHFSLGQNFPNPFTNETTIPFSLNQDSQVTLELWNLNGQKVKTVLQKSFAAGDHTIDLALDKLKLPKANYVYQLEVNNTNGVFRDCKMMTFLK